MNVTIKDIAAAAGISRGTVDRVLHNRSGVNPEVAKRVREIADKMGFVPNKAGKILAARKQKITFAYLLPSSAKPFFDEVLKGVARAEKELSDYGVTVDTHFFKDFKTETHIKEINKIAESGYTGLCITSLDTPEVQLAAARKDPSVVLLMDCTVQSQMAAISRKPDLVLQLKEPALPVVRVAIQRNPGLIRKYQYEFPSLRMEAISRNGFVAKDLSNLTVEEYNAAIAQNDKVARFVKNPATRQENFQARSTVTHHVQLSANDDFLESIEIG